MKPGVVTVYENDGTTKKVFVSSGTITVNEDSSVQVLVEEAASIEDLDSAMCRELLASSQSELSSATTDKVILTLNSMTFLLINNNYFHF